MCLLERLLHSHRDHAAEQALDVARQRLDLSRLLEQAGFAEVEYELLGGGSVALHTAVRPDGERP